MHLVALVESERHVCCRYRLAAFRPLLAAAGHTLEFRPLPRRWFGRVSLGRGLAGADAVIVQRKLLPKWAAALLRSRVRRLVYDFDDAVWGRDSHSPKGIDDPNRAARFRAIVRAADLVVAGNDYLAAEARKWTDPGRVLVIPTCVDVSRYPLVRERSEPGEGSRAHGRANSPSPPTPLPGGERGESPLAERADHAIQLVWVGSRSTLRGLERFAPTLSAVGRAVPGVRLKLICDRFTEIPDLPVDPCPWSEATEAAEIAAADVGIAWVPDDPWSRGKCALKVLQYQAAGLPVVANPVGVQATIVRPGETGLLATTADEWVAAVRQLAANAGLRQRLGAAGRRHVEAEHGIEAGGRRWLAALARLEPARLRRTG